MMKRFIAATLLWILFPTLAQAHPQPADPVTAETDPDPSGFTFTHSTCYEKDGYINREVGFIRPNGAMLGFGEDGQLSWDMMMKGNLGYYGPKPICIAVNGKFLVVDQAPLLRHDRTLVPIRAITYAFGDLSVDWDDKAQTVILKLWSSPGPTLPATVMKIWTLRPGHKEYTIQDMTGSHAERIITVETDVDPVLVRGRMLVPLRFIAENIGAKVEWDQAARVVRITRAPTR